MTCPRCVLDRSAILTTRKKPKVLPRLNLRFCVPDVHDRPSIPRMGENSLLRAGERARYLMENNLGHHGRKTPTPFLGVIYSALKMSRSRTYLGRIVDARGIDR